MVKTSRVFKIQKGTKCAIVQLVGSRGNGHYRQENLKPFTTRQDLEFGDFDCDADPTGNIAASCRDAQSMATDGFFVFTKTNDKQEVWAVIVHHAGVEITSNS